MAGNLFTIDYVLLVLYFAGTLYVGLRVGRRIKGGRDFFLAGRTLPWWAIGFSLVATDIGGTDIIGVGGTAYSHGISVANFEWIGCVPAMILGAFIFIPIFWRAGIQTIPEFFERRFNVGTRTAVATCWLVFMACNIGIMLFASAKMFQSLFGWGAPTSILVTALFVGGYTLVGGLAAVVYTDVIQCVVMIGGCLIVLVMGLVDLGGVGALIDQVNALESARATAAGSVIHERTLLILPVDTTTPFPWTGILFGLGMVLGPAYWFGNQAIVQRSLGARSEFHAKASYVWGALLKNLVPIVIVVPGLIAMVKFPDLQDADAALPTLISSVLPAGLRGIFVAAFVAALMSSVDSYLNSAATLLTNDVYKRFVHPGASDRTLLRVGRWATFGFVLWGIGFALNLARLENSSIYSVFQTLMAFFQGPAMAVLLTGLLWRRATGAGALTGFLGGVACAVSLYLLSLPAAIEALGWEPLFKIRDPYLYFSVWAFLTALFLIVAVSLLTRPEPSEKIDGLVFRRTPV